MEETRDFNKFTLEELLDFLHASKVCVSIYRKGDVLGEPYLASITFNGTGLNNNQISVRLSGSGQHLRYVVHGLVKDYLRLK